MPVVALSTIEKVIPSILLYSHSIQIRLSTHSNSLCLYMFGFVYTLRMFVTAIQTHSDFNFVLLHRILPEKKNDTQPEIPYNNKHQTYTVELPQEYEKNKKHKHQHTERENKKKHAVLFYYGMNTFFFLFGVVIIKHYMVC